MAKWEDLDYSKRIIRNGPAIPVFDAWCSWIYVSTNSMVTFTENKWGIDAVNSLPAKFGKEWSRVEPMWHRWHLLTRVPSNPATYCIPRISSPTLAFTRFTIFPLVDVATICQLACPPASHLFYSSSFQFCRWRNRIPLAVLSCAMWDLSSFCLVLSANQFWFLIYSE